MTIEGIGVVLPAHDEGDTIGAAITAICRSADAVGDVPWALVVVLDRCTDHSAVAAGIAIEAAGLAGADHVRLLSVVAGNAGRARRVGVAAAARHLGLHPGAADADSVVGPRWLATHRAAADAGVALLAGPVGVADWSDWPIGLAAAHERHRSGPGHGRQPPVYGANLGFRLAAYLAAGGFRSVPAGEDRALFDAVSAGGWPVAVGHGEPVITSARRRARTEQGFAGCLRRLEADLADASLLDPAPPAPTAGMGV